MFARLFERFGSYVCGGLLVALVVTTTGWYISDARLDACKAGRKADRTAYEKAQSDAEILWMKAIKKKEQEYAKLAEKADEEVNSLIEKNAEYAKLCNEQENKIQ